MHINKIQINPIGAHIAFTVVFDNNVTFTIKLGNLNIQNARYKIARKTRPITKKFFEKITSYFICFLFFTK